MAEEKRPGMTKISLWLDNEVLAGIDFQAKRAQRSRTSFIQIEFARQIGVFRLLPEYGAVPEKPEEEK